MNSNKHISKTVDNLLTDGSADWKVLGLSCEGFILVPNYDQKLKSFKSVDEILLKAHGDTLAQIVIRGLINYTPFQNNPQSKNELKKLGYESNSNNLSDEIYLIKTFKLEKLPYELNGIEQAFNIKK